MHKRSLVLLFITAASLAFAGPKQYKLYVPFVHWQAAPKRACKGQILCTVYEDSNRNGRRDDNEVGVPGIGVVLRHLDGSDEARTLTDQRGQASFAVEAGRYAIQAEGPNDYEWTTPDAYGVDIVCATIPLNFGTAPATRPAGPTQLP